jgi:hypothetical protein
VKARPIYVETLIHAPLDEVWRATQDPVLHEQWDLRFSTIEYLPKNSEADPQRFLYRTRIGLGMEICGEGESTGERALETGTRTSALRFWSGDAKSLIEEGSGYWKYVPLPEGTRFYTWYDYRTRFGWAGGLLDGWCFRPLIGWATAWSFDRLRMWLEQGLDPGVAARSALAHGFVRLALAAVWIYQGFVPKLLYRDTGELELLQSVTMVRDFAPEILTFVGVSEIAFGIGFLILWTTRELFVVNIVVLLVLLAGAVISNPGVLVEPFNPIALTVAMCGLSAAAWVIAPGVPSANRCLRAPKQ